MKTPEEAWKEWCEKEGITEHWTYTNGIIQFGFFAGWSAALKRKSPSEENENQENKT